MRIQAMLEKLLDDFKEFTGREEVLDFYFAVRNFLAVNDKLDENYEIYASFDNKGDFFIKLYCINPSVNLRECMDKGISSIFFSATLLPVNYYKGLLSGDEEDYAIYTNSPFDKSNRLIISAKDVSSKYTRRNENEYMKMFKYIKSIAGAKKGNYMVFFPSYKMMDEVYKYSLEGNDDVKYIMQNSNMSEQDREDFINTFYENKNIVAFCVLGGVFSEGIDLKNDSLIGSIIIGTGLPQVCTEREILKKHFDGYGNGFDYAYRYPGINKVLQAAGRVIRTDKDKGVIALLDERFMEASSRRLFPMEWDDVRYINYDEAENVIDGFWKGIKEDEMD